MIIKSIELRNFRQFRDPLKIDFNTDGRVTVIVANNGVGKSTLLQAFKWILYDETDFKLDDGRGSEKDNILYNTELHNEKPLNGTHKTTGTIIFENEGRTYKLTRTYTYVKTGSKSVIQAKNISLIYDDPILLKSVTVPEEEIVKTINSIIPEALQDYFLFDGENNTLNSKDKGSEKLKDSIYQIFDLDIYQNIIDIIGTPGNKYSLKGMVNQSRKKQLETISLTGNLNTLYNKKIDLETEADKLDKEISEILNVKVPEIDRKLSDIKEKLSNYGDDAVSKLERERSEIERMNKLFIGNSETLLNDIGDGLSVYLPQLLLSKLSLSTIEVLSKKRNVAKTFVGVRKETLDEILHTKKCICGRCLDQDAEDNIQSLLKGIPPKGFESCLNDFKKASFSDDRLDEKREDIEKKLSQVSDIHDTLASNEERLKEIKHLMTKNAGSESLENARTRLEEDRDNLLFRMGDKRRESDDKKRKIGLIENEIRKLQANDAVSKKFEDYDGVINDVVDYATKLLEDNLSVVRENLNNSMKEVFEKISSTRMDKMYLDENFRFITMAEGGTNYKSGGQSIIDMYTYITGIIKTLNKTNIDKEFPLIIDAPFTKIDDEQLPRVVQQLKSISKQTVFFTFDVKRLDIEDKTVYGNIWYLKAKNDRKREAYAVLGGE